jgi:hypothetical protein
VVLPPDEPSVVKLRPVDGSDTLVENETGIPRPVIKRYDYETRPELGKPLVPVPRKALCTVEGPRRYITPV